MRGLADWLESQRANATTNFALGPQRFAQMIRDTEMVDTPLDELERIGRADLARNQQALREACATYAPGATMTACMDRMAANKPAGGPVAAARAQLAGLRAFIVAARPRLDPRHRAGPCRGGAALQPPELGLYRHSRAL